MHKTYKHQKGSAAILSVMVFGTISLLALTTMMGRGNTQRLALQSGQINREVDQLTGEIAGFLSDSNLCLKNFGGSFSAGQITLTSLLRSDNTPRYDNVATYLQGRASIESFVLSNYVPDPSAPLTNGSATLTVSFRSLAQKIGSTQLRRSFPISLQVNGSMDILGCTADVFMDRYWVGNEQSAYYSAGRVGIGGNGVSIPPIQALELDTSKPPTWGPRDSIRFGTTQGELSIRPSPGCGGTAVDTSAGTAIGIRTSLAQNPTIISKNPSAFIAVNYPLGVIPAANMVHIRSSDNSPWLGYHAAGVNATWYLGPNASNDMVLSSQNTTATPRVYFCHPNHSSGVGTSCGGSVAGTEVADVRVGSDTARPNTTLSFWVDGESHGSSAWNSFSDRRLKEQIRPLREGLKELHKINGYFFRWKNQDMGRDREVGLIAQELIENHVAEELVDCSGAHCIMQYPPLTAVLTKATQELGHKQSAWAKKIRYLKKNLKINASNSNVSGALNE